MRLAGTALALAVSACGLLAAPGGYATGDVEDRDAATVTSSPEASTSDGPTNGPSGTLAILAGERSSTGPDDEPAWASDVWLANLDEQGRVTGYTIARSAPVVGPFDAVGVSGGKLMTLSFGFGIGGGNAHALQTIGWAPGPTGDWTAAPAPMPGGLNDFARAFFGTHVVIVGGTRQVTVDGSTMTNWTDEVHVADVDVAAGTLGSTSNTGRSLARSRSRASVLVTGSRLYVVGGRTSFSAITNTVELAPLDETAGTVGEFEEQPSMESNGAQHRVFLPALCEHQGWLFVVGGRTTPANAPTTVVLVAKIDPATGTLSSFMDAGPLPSARRDLACAGHGGKVYVVGGILEDGSRTDEVLSASIRADGTLEPWDVSHAKLPSPRSDIVIVGY